MTAYLLYNGSATYIRQLFVGGNLGVDNGRDFQQLNGAVYLRYALEPQDRALALPVSPYRSPYDN